MKRIIKGIVLVALIASLLAWVKLARVPVAQAEARTDPLVVEVMGTGTLEARVKTTISPRIQEHLDEVLVDQGDAVQEGQLLARLNDSDIRAQIEIATAALSAAQAGVTRIKSAETRAVAIEKNARLNHQRIAALVSKQMVSQEAMDNASEQLQTAEADVNQARAAIAETESQVVTARKTLLYQQQRLSYTRVISPYDGLVVRRDRDPGGVVVPGGSLMLLVVTNELWVSAWVNETASSGLSVGQPARVVFRSDETNTVAGEVARLGRETDRETREFLVDVRVRALPPNWTVGQRAEVFIETGRAESALAVPQKFIQWRSGKPGVFVNEAGVARWRGVTLGLHGREKAEIAKGLTAGEQVVCPATAKQSALTDGQRIKVQ
jgi:RND family efflux transporter MFP subunit